MQLLERERPAATNNPHHFEPIKILKKLTDRQPVSSGVRTRRRYGPAAALLAAAIGASACTPEGTTVGGAPAQPPATEAPAPADPAPPQPTAPHAHEDPAPLAQINCEAPGSEFRCPSGSTGHVLEIWGDKLGIKVEDPNGNYVFSQEIPEPVNLKVQVGATCITIFQSAVDGDSQVTEAAGAC